ncbi:MAG: hypothetical protein M1820_001677 [Bogoriella megaspora]|nr:MAG: hypothetical protein M1820_001677 [Bogoriella megaspora]
MDEQLQSQHTRAFRQQFQNEDASKCALCDVVYLSDAHRFEHFQEAHSEETLEAFHATSALNVKSPTKSRVFNNPTLKKSAGSGEPALGPRPPSAESMKVEPVSRSQTPTRPTAENFAQLSLQQRQHATSPRSQLLEANSQPSAASPSSRKRAASDQPPAANPHQLSQIQSFQAQRRDASSGDVKLGVPGSAKVDPEFAGDHPYSLGSGTTNVQSQSFRKSLDSDLPGASHARKASSPTAMQRTDKSQRAIESAQPAIREKQGIGPVSSISRLASPEVSGYEPRSQGSPISRAIPHHTRGVFPVPSQARYPDLIMQPDSRPISNEQLAAEVKSIYAGLVMVEGKCISVDTMETTPEQQFTSEHWQALVALHRTLLHEHHDFLLASQHPSANSALRRLAAKYSMPGRMWKHGIHSFLELMRKHLPGSREYMIAFILLAYQMMALLYETVPAFEQTWVECLGDLGRYRMAVEDDDFRDRETWGGVARSWYSKAADSSPEIGRLYHHLAILAGPNALQKLFYYVKSLLCEQPFISARDSVLTLFDPLLSNNPPAFARSHPGDASFIRLHAKQFGRSSMDSSPELRKEYTNQLDGHIGRVTAKYNEAGVYTAVANIAGILGYGSLENGLIQAYYQTFNIALDVASGVQQASPPSQSRAVQQPVPSGGSQEITFDADQRMTQYFPQACQLAFDTFQIVLNRIGDKNILPYVYVFLVFTLGTFELQRHATAYLHEAYPWGQLAHFLNTLANSEDVDSHFDFFSESLRARPSKGDHKALPEDFLIRGQIWCKGFFSAEWFDDNRDVEERMLERASTSKARAERICAIGTRIASYSQWLHYDPAARRFTAKRGLFPSVTEARNEEAPVSLERSSSASPIDDSLEMLFIKKSAEYADFEEKSGLSRRMLMTVPASDTSAAAQLAVRNYTRLIFGWMMLLNEISFFNATVQGGGFDVVIPDAVISHLVFLEGVSLGDFKAREALHAIKNAIDQGKRVTIKTADGIDVTNQAFSTTSIKKPLNRSHDLEEFVEEATMKIARRESDRSLEDTRAPSEEARPAILISDDRKTRLKANGFRVAAIAHSFLNRVITQARRRSISRESSGAGRSGHRPESSSCIESVPRAL